MVSVQSGGCRSHIANIALLLCSCQADDNHGSRGVSSAFSGVEQSVSGAGPRAAEERGEGRRVFSGWWRLTDTFVGSRCIALMLLVCLWFCSRMWSAWIRGGAPRWSWLCVWATWSQPGCCSGTLWTPHTATHRAGPVSALCCGSQFHVLRLLRGRRRRKGTYCH